MRTALTFDECEAILSSEHYGHLGCVDEGDPLVYPVTFVYRHGAIYSHTHEGEKIRVMRKNPRICLQVEHVKSGYEWESVMCRGTFEEVVDAQEAHEIQLLLAEQYAQISLAKKKVPVSPVIEDLHRKRTVDLKKTVVYTINLTKTTGMAERPH